MNGLFCERIFGPVNDWECHCGKYKRVRYRKELFVNVVALKLSIPKSDVIVWALLSLASPVTHVWYVKARPSKIALLIRSYRLKEFEQIVYFNAYVST